MIMNHQHKWSTMASNSHLNTVNIEWVAAVYADLASPASALLNAPETVNEYEKFINQAKREWVKLRCEQRQLFVFVQIIFHSHINTQSQLGTMTRMIMSLCVACVYANCFFLCQIIISICIISGGIFIYLKLNAWSWEKIETAKELWLQQIVITAVLWMWHKIIACTILSFTIHKA